MFKKIIFSLLISVFLMSCEEEQFDDQFTGWEVIVKNVDLESFYTINKDIYVLSDEYLITNDSKKSYIGSISVQDMCINEGGNSYLISKYGKVYRGSGEISDDITWYYTILNSSLTLTKIVNVDEDYWIIGSNDIESIVYRKNSSVSGWNGYVIGSPNLKYIYFISTNRGWAFGENKIYSSDNSGTTWQLQKTDESITFTSVNFINMNEGWLSDDNGTIYHTLNAGELWEEIYSNSDYVFKTIDFIDNKVGWAGGFNNSAKDEYFNGILLYTIDGGNSWTEHPFSIQTIYEIEFTDTNTAYAMGDHFLIYTNTGGH